MSPHFHPVFPNILQNCNIISRPEYRLLYNSLILIGYPQFYWYSFLSLSFSFSFSLRPLPIKSYVYVHAFTTIVKIIQSRYFHHQKKPSCSPFKTTPTTSYTPHPSNRLYYGGSLFFIVQEHFSKAKKFCHFFFNSGKCWERICFSAHCFACSFPQEV